MRGHEILHKIVFLLRLRIRLVIDWQRQSLFDEVVDIARQITVSSRNKKPVGKQVRKASIATSLSNIFLKFQGETLADVSHTRKVDDSC